MLIDSYFVIGQDHVASGLPCQDYAIHGSNWGAIADGCGGSEGRTDIGARVLCLSFEAWQKTDKAMLFADYLQVYLNQHLSWLSVPDLLATLVAFEITEKAAVTWIFGDGGIVVRFKNGTTVVYKVEWQDNTPCYAAYFLTGTPVLQGELQSWQNEIELLKVPLTSQVGRHGLALTFPLQEIDSLAICSDGLFQFKNLSAVQVTEEFTHFKSLAGTFLKRRMIKGLKSLKTQDCFPVDDFSMAIWMNDNAENIC